jgi:hypothetical protein
MPLKRLHGIERYMPPRSHLCQGKCKHKFLDGQSVFQAYAGAWSTPYITPSRHKFLGNWCIECFQRDLGHLILSQTQPYSCGICQQAVIEHEQVIYVTFGTIPKAPYFRAESRGIELHIVVCQNCWEEPQFKPRYKIYEFLHHGG